MGGNLFNPDDILSTMGGQTTSSANIEIEEENELNIKESTSLLSAPSSTAKTTINMTAYPAQGAHMNSLQAKQAMQEKMRK